MGIAMLRVSAGGRRTEAGLVVERQNLSESEEKSDHAQPPSEGGRGGLFLSPPAPRPPPAPAPPTRPSPADRRPPSTRAIQSRVTIQG